MTRTQRKVHLVMWLVLGPLVLAALAWSIVDRPEVPASPSVVVPE